MKKLKVLSIGLTFCMSLAVMSTAYAGTATKPLQVNTDPNNWDRPNAGNFVASYSSGDNFIYSALEGIYWSPTQIQNSLPVILYPTLDLKEDGNHGKIVGYAASSNLPNPKFDLEDDGGNGVDEVEVVIQDKAGLTGWTRYNFSANWRINDYNANPYIIAYSGQSYAPLYPGGDYNNFSGREDSLQGANWSEFKNSSFTASTNDKSDATTTLNAVETTDKSKVNPKAIANTDYDKINNKAELDKFKAKAHDLLQSKNKQAAESSKNRRFTITFNSPQKYEDIEKYLSNKGIKAKTLYARGINSNGERVTIATIDFSKEVINQLVTDKSYNFKGFTEIEGEASATELSKHSNNPDVFAIEVEDEETGARPMGLTWKLEQYNK